MFSFDYVCNFNFFINLSGPVYEVSGVAITYSLVQQHILQFTYLFSLRFYDSDNGPSDDHNWEDDPWNDFEDGTFVHATELNREWKWRHNQFHTVSFGVDERYPN